MTQPAPETQDLDEAAIAAALTRMGLLPAGEQPRCQPMTGGVSSDIWLIDVPGRLLSRDDARASAHEHAAGKLLPICASGIENE